MTGTTKHIPSLTLVQIPLIPHPQLAEMQEEEKENGGILTSPENIRVSFPGTVSTKAAQQQVGAVTVCHSMYREPKCSCHIYSCGMMVQYCCYINNGNSFLPRYILWSLAKIIEEPTHATVSFMRSTVLRQLDQFH